MAHYAYKRACYDLIPAEWRQQWGVKFKEKVDREPDGDAGYDGDFWHMAADYIEHQQGQLDEAKAIVADKAYILERYAQQKDELAAAKARIAQYEQDWAAIAALGASLRAEEES